MEKSPLTCKVVIVGNQGSILTFPPLFPTPFSLMLKSGVGKTCIAKRYVEGVFPEQGALPNHCGSSRMTMPLLYLNSN
jgi:hypothetical protein